MRHLTHPKRVIAEGLTILAFGLMVLVAASMKKEVALLENGIDELHPMAMRGTVQDRLIGREVDLSNLIGADVGGGESPWRLVWIVDVERCEGCIENLGPWTRLQQSADHELFVLPVGSLSADTNQRLRVLDGATVVELSREQVQEAFGPILSSTKILVNRNGIAVMVDSRETHRECGWSFEAVVETITANGDADMIRRVGRITQTSDLNPE